MLAAALAAFVVPSRLSAPAQAHLQVLFIPVAKPIYMLGGWSHDRVVREPIRDDGSPQKPRTRRFSPDTRWVRCTVCRSR